MTTGEKIKEARKKAGLTQKELGARLGVAYQSVAQWENGLRNPKRETLRRIADALNIEEYELDPDVSPQIAAIWKTAKAITTPPPGLQYLTNRSKLLRSFDALNNDGQRVAVERVEELTEIPKYQRNPDNE